MIPKGVLVVLDTLAYDNFFYHHTSPTNSIKMKISILGSGSKGNCTYIESDGKSILIDAGFSGKEIEKRLARINRSADCLKAILITHEHNDHIAGAGVLSRRYKLPVYLNERTYLAAAKKLGKLNGVEYFVTGESFCLGDFSIHPFSISHDTADPVGFVLKTEKGSMGYCTDTGRLTRLIAHRLASCSALVLECNHDPHMLRTGPYPFPLQQRISSSTGHLCNEDALQFAFDLANEKLRCLFLAHLSETNNDANLVKKMSQQKLINTSCTLDLHVAHQENPTPLVDLELYF
jgi:phosphoribosyl 1,2-cyclic phosphodiesterase